MILRNFCVFEGIDGTGTTTQLRLLKEAFARRDGIENGTVHFTCEPSSSSIGVLIRKILKGDIKVHPDTLARLFASDRCEHLYGDSGIVKTLDAGKAVFSDRYFFSSLAYQGESGDPELSRKLNEDFPLPEYLFFFDLDSSKAMDRVEARQGDLEIFEKREFQQKVRSRYLEIITGYERSQSGMKVVRIDASLPIETIAKNIWSEIAHLPIL